MYANMAEQITATTRAAQELTSYIAEGMRGGGMDETEGRSGAWVARRHGDHAVQVRPEGRTNGNPWEATIRPEVVALYASSAIKELPDSADDALRAELRWLSTAEEGSAHIVSPARRLALDLCESCLVGLGGGWGRPVPADYDAFFSMALEDATRRNARRRVTGESVVLGMLTLAWNEPHGGGMTPREKAHAVLRALGVMADGGSDDDGGGRPALEKVPSRHVGREPSIGDGRRAQGARVATSPRGDEVQEELFAQLLSKTENFGEGGLEPPSYESATGR